MPNRSKGMGQFKCSLSSFRLGVERGAKDPTPENLLLQNHGGGQDPTQGCSDSKEKIPGTRFC
jgi:hypothetical protein